MGNDDRVGGAGVGGMSVGDMMAMKSALEDKLRAMGMQEADSVEALNAALTRSAVHPAQAQGQAANALPPRTSLKQLYEVVFDGHVAVRLAPSLDAPFFRRLDRGARVELFEWDHTRRWRRVTLERACNKEDQEVAEQVPQDRGSPGNGLGPISGSPCSHPRWSDNPVWDNARKCWTDGAGDKAGGPAREGVTFESDGWVLVEHPQLGQLLHAVLPDDIEAAAPEGSTTTMEPMVLDSHGRAGIPHPGSPMQEQSPAGGDREASVGQRRLPAGRVQVADWEDAWNNFDWANAQTRLPPWRPGTQPPPQPLVITFAAEAKQEEAARPATQGDVFGEPSLMVATREKNYGAVKRLLEQRADPDEADALGENALFEAASVGSTQLVALLLLHGADPAHTNNQGLPLGSITDDIVTKVLLDKWQGRPVSDRHLHAALGRVDKDDVGRVAAHCKVRWPLVKGTQRVAGAVATSPEVQLPVKYQVVYKKVAVRKEPNKEAAFLRSMQYGDTVLMFEWDATHSWRKVHINAIDAEAGGVREMDGWMLIESPTLGALLREVAPDQREGGPDDEFAG